MLAEFVEYLFELFKDQKAVELGATPAPLPADLQTDKRLKRFWDPHAKVIGDFAVAPPDRRHTVNTLNALIDFVSYWRDADSDKAITIWVGASKIVAVLNDEDRRDLVTLPLVKTPLWLLLDRLVAKPLQTQAEAIRLLRQDLHEFDPGEKALLSSRNMKLTRTENNESTTNPGNSRMSRSILQEAAGAKDFPETLKVSAWPYLGVIPTKDGTPYEGYALLLWLEIDFDNMGIRFEPEASAMVDAINREQLRLVEQLEESTGDIDGVHVFAGDANLS